LFSEGKTPEQVVIALDIPADMVQAMYQLDLFQQDR
jgi:hypothetical protein